MSRLLQDKPAGCVIWQVYSENQKTGRFDITYKYLGGDTPNEPVDLSKYPQAYHSRRNRDGEKVPRKNTVDVAVRDATPVKDIEGLLLLLFGPMWRSSPLP